MLSVTFTPTEDEFRRVNQRLRLMSPRPARPGGTALNLLFVLATTCGGYGLFGVLIAMFRADTSRITQFAIDALCAGGGFALLLTWAVVRQSVVQRMAARLDRFKAVPATVTISESGITVSDEDAVFLQRWPAIQRIETTEEFALFAASTDGGPFVLARAFDDVASFEQFVQRAREWRDRAAADASEVR